MNKELTFEEAIEQIKQEGAKARETIEAAEQLAEIINDIVEARTEKGITQRQLAEMCGIKQSAIARMESVQAVPRLDTLIRIARCLDLKLKVVDETKQLQTGKTVIINFPEYSYGDIGWGNALRSLTPAFRGA